jgi:hypothetical protein
MNNLERLKFLLKEYSILREDLFELKFGGKKVPIITRTGIEKIMSKANITIKYELSHITAEHKYIVIKAIAKMGDQELETYGESSPANCSQSYPVAIAEKRAKARAVLQLAGFYSEGVYSEDEFEASVIKANRVQDGENV